VRLSKTGARERRSSGCRDHETKASPRSILIDRQMGERGPSQQKRKAVYESTCSRTIPDSAIAASHAPRADLLTFVQLDEVSRIKRYCPWLTYVWVKVAVRSSSRRRARTGRLACAQRPYLRRTERLGVGETCSCADAEWTSSRGESSGRRKVTASS
jgi:hypothetical protein